ncbi:MAG: hypothetical protein US51_C0035G0009 [Microgenomates group bacterium GW2011_GWA2_37_6]|nr:MAG: hypothetical protein US51_C0035G0009 [Microgenomates group bacterium GW2011_GWA2_37_6]
MGILLRLYNVSEIPPGINRDEGSIGYTAYSLLKSGKDEYGISYPLSFQSFGDWKLPLYIYSTVPFVAIFGLTELSVRLTSIIAGIGTIILTFFLVKELFKNNFLSLMAMFLIAISPWHIHLSRVESESNTAVFLTTASVLLFLKGIQNRNWLFIPSLILLALTYYTYAGNYIFTTLLFFGFAICFYKSIPKSRTTYIALACFAVLSLIIFSQTVFSANKTKLSGISIFGDPSVVHAKIELPRNEHNDMLFKRIIHNRPVFALERMTQNYLNSFSPDFLFINGGTNKAHNIQNFGNMYIVESVFLLLGFIFVFTRKNKREYKLILLWFLIAPIAAIITKDAPHTNRMFAIFPALPIITAFGFYSFWERIKNNPIKKIMIIIVGTIFLFNVLLYLDRYFIHFPRNEVKNWGFGYKNLNMILEERYPAKSVVMAAPTHSPYIFLLFYSGYSPSKFSSEAVRYPITEDGFIHVKSYQRFEFRDIDWSKDIERPNSVLVANPSEIPPFYMSDEFKKSFINLPNGERMFAIIETQ